LGGFHFMYRSAPKTSLRRPAPGAVKEVIGSGCWNPAETPLAAEKPPYAESESLTGTKYFASPA
jgi:hypothetical protein